MATLALVGCAGQGPTLQAPVASPTGSITAADRKAPDVTNPDLTFPASTQPIDLYAQLARSANACWFGADGPLKKSHIFTAEAAPPSNGGHAHIILLERDVSVADQRGVRAFQIVMTPIATGSQVAIANARLSPEAALAMGRDVTAWSRGEASCMLRSVMPAAPAPLPQQNPVAAVAHRKAR